MLTGLVKSSAKDVATADPSSCVENFLTVGQQFNKRWHLSSGVSEFCSTCKGSARGNLDTTLQRRCRFTSKDREPSGLRNSETSGDTQSLGETQSGRQFSGIPQDRHRQQHGRHPSQVSRCSTSHETDRSLACALHQDKVRNGDAEGRVHRYDRVAKCASVRCSKVPIKVDDWSKTFQMGMNPSSGVGHEDAQVRVEAMHQHQVDNV